MIRLGADLHRPTPGAWDAAMNEAVQRKAGAGHRASGAAQPRALAIWLFGIAGLICSWW